MRLIKKGETCAGFGADGEAVVTDNIASKAGGAAETNGRPVFTFAEHSGAIRCLNNVGHMASGADVGYAHGHAVVEYIEDFANEDACVKRDGLAGFEIDFTASFGAHFLDEFDQLIALVIGARNVMTAAKVDPLQLPKIRRDLWLKRLPCAFERCEILFAQGVEMQT